MKKQPTKEQCDALVDQVFIPLPSEPPVRSSALLGRAALLRDNDWHTYLLPFVSWHLNKLQPFEREYEREVMKETVTHTLWLRFGWWKFQRMFRANLNLVRPNLR